MVTAVKKRLKATIGFLPYELVLDRLGREPRPVTSFSVPTEAIYSQSDVIFAVPPEKCKYTYQFSYGLEGWHPFVRTVRQFMKDDSLTYERSALHDYYQAFQPRTLLDLFFDGQEKEDLAETSLGKWAIGTHYPCLPWDPHLVPMRGEGGLSVADGLQGFGPVSDAKGRWEFRRLIETYQSIRRKGYRPSRDSDGEIRGYFLRMDDRYRFLIRAGFHRTAVLSALEQEMLRVKFKANFPRVIDLGDLESWPLVKKGLIEPEVAKRVFTRFFTEDGTGKAKNLGLL